MHGSFYFPENRTLLVVDPWRHVLVDPDGNQVGWDGPLFDGFNVSPRNRGRMASAGVVEDTRGL